MFFRGNKKHPWLFGADHPTISNIKFHYWSVSPMYIGSENFLVFPFRSIKYGLFSIRSHKNWSSISIKWAYSPCQSRIDEVPIHKKRTSKFPADPERITKSGKRLQFANWKDPPSLRTVNQPFLWAMFNSYVTNCQRVYPIKWITIPLYKSH